MTDLKKHLIKALTFWIFPKLLKKQAVGHLQYLFGLSSAKPAPLLEQFIYRRTQRNFIKTHQIDNIFAYRIISLGTSCLPRTLPTQWGLKPRKNQGELGYPFDLSVNTLPAIVKYVSNNFSGYFDDLYYDNTLKVWKNRTDGTIYNHDLDCSAEERNKFIERFNRRIDNFRQILEQDTKPAIFISHYNIDTFNTTESLDKVYQMYAALYQKISDKRQNRGFKMLIVDLSGKLKSNRLPPEIILCSYPYLPASYIWYQNDYRQTKIGLQFELSLAQTLFKLISQLQS